MQSEGARARTVHITYSVNGRRNRFSLWMAVLQYNYFVLPSQHFGERAQRHGWMQFWELEAKVFFAVVILRTLGRDTSSTPVAELRAARRWFLVVVAELELGSACRGLVRLPALAPERELALAALDKILVVHGRVVLRLADCILKRKWQPC